MRGTVVERWHGKFYVPLTDSRSSLIAQYTRDRAKNLEDTFQLIDQERKGYINQKDIQNLAKDVGEEYASEEKTKALITSFCTNSTSNHHGRVMNRHEFYRLFSPPEP